MSKIKQTLPIWQGGTPGEKAEVEGKVWREGTGKLKRKPPLKRDRTLILPGAPRKAKRTTGFVYYLRDPRTSEVRYIGQTARTVELRLIDHCGETKSREKREWIAELKKLGLFPTIETVAEVPICELTYRENLCIRAGILLGWPLLNKVSVCFSQVKPEELVNVLSDLCGHLPI